MEKISNYLNLKVLITSIIAFLGIGITNLKAEEPKPVKPPIIATKPTQKNEEPVLKSEPRLVRKKDISTDEIKRLLDSLDPIIVKTPEPITKKEHLLNKFIDEIVTKIAKSIELEENPDEEKDKEIVDLIRELINKFREVEKEYRNQKQDLSSITNKLIEKLKENQFTNYHYQMYLKTLNLQEG
jgi:hypothetical protein